MDRKSGFCYTNNVGKVCIFGNQAPQWIFDIGLAIQLPNWPLPSTYDMLQYCCYDNSLFPGDAMLLLYVFNRSVRYNATGCIWKKLYFCVAHWDYTGNTGFGFSINI